MNLSRSLAVSLLSLLVSVSAVACGDDSNDDKADTSSTSVTFSELHPLFVMNCTGDGTCHGNGTDTGMYPHPEFANTDEGVSKGYVDAKIDTILTRINSTELDPAAFGTRRMPPSDYNPAGLNDAQKAMIQAYADTLR